MHLILIFASETYFHTNEKFSHNRLSHIRYVLLPSEIIKRVKVLLVKYTLPVLVSSTLSTVLLPATQIYWAWMYSESTSMTSSSTSELMIGWITTLLDSRIRSPSFWQSGQAICPVILLDWSSMAYSVQFVKPLAVSPNESASKSAVGCYRAAKKSTL